MSSGTAETEHTATDPTSTSIITTASSSTRCCSMSWMSVAMRCRLGKRSLHESSTARGATRRCWSGSSHRMASFPPIGRSLAYRFGAFHLLAQMALRRSLPESVSPAQARGALTATIRRSIEAPGTFDADGWLRIGFCGHQPGMGEPYISTGSLYLCSVGLLPLGLSPTDEFWSASPQPWTSVRAWSGQAFSIDKALAP